MDAYESLKKVCLERQSYRSYKGIPFAEGVLEDILAVAQRAPSSFNTQPYKVIICRSDKDRKTLSECMMDVNQLAVNTSSATLIILSDLKPSLGFPDLQQMARDAGKSEEEAIGSTSLVHYFVDEPWLLGFGFDIALSIKRLSGVVPRRNTVQGWAFKQSALFVSQLLLLAKAHGIDIYYYYYIYSLVEEGFDFYKVRNAFNIPSRYDICCCVSLGYHDRENRSQTKRLNPEKMFFEGSFGHEVSTSIPHY
ncbi:hypothetical protein WA158_001960 [Blastocystis sp. Blastoise]